MKKLISIFCVLAMALTLAVMPVQASTTNLVTNSDFETGIDGWKIATGATAVPGADYAKTGSYGVLVTPSEGSAASEQSFAYEFDVEANKTYFISAWVKPGEASKQVLATASGTGLTDLNGTTAIPTIGNPTTDWYKVVNCITPTQTGKATFYIQRSVWFGSTDGLLSSYCIDDVEIYELKLANDTNLDPTEGVISVNFPADMGITKEMVTLSSGTVTDVAYDNGWNIAYFGLNESAACSVSFTIPVDARNTMPDGYKDLKQTFSFTTKKATVAGNLVENADFETGIDGWTKAANTAVEQGAGYAHTGSNGVFVTPDAAATAFEESFAYKFPVEANKTYFVSAWVKPSVNNKQVLPAVSIDGNIITGTAPLLMSRGTEWYKLTASFTASKTGDASFFIRRSLYNAGLSVSGANVLPAYYLDDVAIYELKLAKKTNLEPASGVISVNFPADMGITSDMITLSSGSVTGVTYKNGNWNVAYANLTPGDGTVSFAIPVNAANNNLSGNHNLLSQSFDFKTKVPGNLVDNSDFETGTDGWTTAEGATAVVGAEYAYTGENGVLVTPAANDAPEEESFAYKFSVEKDKTYLVSAWVKPMQAHKQVLPEISIDGTVLRSRKPVLANTTVGWYKLVTSFTAAATGDASFFVRRNVWDTGSNLLSSYCIDDVVITEVKLAQNTDLAPESGVISVNFPQDLAITAEKITLSSGSVTGVTYADGSWNIAYANLTPGTGTITFAIPVNAENNNVNGANIEFTQTFNFKTEIVEKTICDNEKLTATGLVDGTTLTINLTAAEAKTVYVMAADYSGTKMTAVQFAKPAVTSEGASVEFTGINDNCKLFIWDTELMPVCNALSVSALK